MDFKKAVCEEIDLRRKEIIELGELIWRNPELGYKEYKTAGFVKEAFGKLGLSYTDGHALTGVKAWAKGKREGIRIAVMGEMDAVVCPQHPEADPNTGAAHACGHHAQVAAMMGAAFGLVGSGVMEHLPGNVCFFAVPAEEYVELEYREKLKREGKITYFGGKQELIHAGVFDDIDMAMMVHAQAIPQRKVLPGGGSLGFIGKTVRFIGKEAHAGGAPHEGVNALNAAMAAMLCIHAQRETFRDEDGIRVHPILTKGGDLVNIIPADVRMETYVRGKNTGAILDANRKIDRAIKGASYAIGAEAIIETYPGYLPMVQNAGMGELFEKNAAELLGENCIIRGVDLAGSTDVGDLSLVMPLIHPLVGGYEGAPHSKDFRVVDAEMAYLIPAKLMAMTVVDLLISGDGNGVVQALFPQNLKDKYQELWKEIN